MGIDILQLAETTNKDKGKDGYQKCQQVNTDNLSIILQFTFRFFIDFLHMFFLSSDFTDKSEAVLLIGLFTDFRGCLRQRVTR